MLLWPEASASLLTLRCVFPPWQPVVGLLSVSALYLSLHHHCESCWAVVALVT